MDSPQTLLRALYEVHDEGNGPLMRSEGRAQRRVFFTESLAAALEREIDRPDPEELGNLDFDPFYNAQETELGAMDIAVAKVSGNATVALVRSTTAAIRWNRVSRNPRRRGLADRRHRVRRGPHPAQDAARGVSVPMTALMLAGATGLVGAQALELLLQGREWSVCVPARRDFGKRHARLQLAVGDLGDGATLARIERELPALDAFACAIGTTLKKAGSAAAFTAVDRDLVLALAGLARRRGARHAVVVSSVVPRRVFQPVSAGEGRDGGGH